MLNFKTHEMVGALSMEMVLVETHAGLHWWTPVLVVAAGLAAPVPDIDQPESWIAHKIPLGQVVGRFVRHRTVTHSLLFLALLWVVLLRVVQIPLPLGLSWHSVAWALWIGYASHPLADLLNPQGVQLLWPLPWWVKVLPEPIAIPVESGREALLHAILTLLVVLIAAAFAVAHLPGHVPFVTSLSHHILSIITF
ncbi:metal-dependent hydrolase [Alicyclobacillus sp. SO9]|uniref:metal-dependent hydrolase n=1 Tax=Alicyclobacillus sp. SO9 TaxID=2665646 RepID=UPI0018E7AC38|nr:metal-dependent hydrolase [Alicyclobacillus sp. SO9]QQE79665.1 metal-dependent hydrolase [Alicyclobacillus sp. SO9]